jgi:hypothetical protein
MDGLHLRLGDGRKLHYVGQNDDVLFFDPSVSGPGPQAALVDHDAFVNLLKQQDLTAVWVIAGEKGVYGGRDPGMGFGGRLVHSFVYLLKDGGFACHKHIDHEYPSPDQLEKLLGYNPQGDARQTETKKGKRTPRSSSSLRPGRRNT